jgi:hypothetical protein
MHLTLLTVALVLNVAVALYLKPWAQVANWIGAVRGERQINAFRVAGLLLILVTVSRAQVHEDPVPHLSAFCTPQEFHALVCLEPRMYIDNEGTNWQYDGEIIWMNHKKYAVINGPAAKTGNEATNQFVVGVERDQDWETARATAKANGIDIAGWSRGNDVTFYSVTPEEQDWTNYFWTPATSKANPKLAKSLLFVWHNAGLLALAAFICFLVVHYGGGGEADETNIHEQLDPEYRTGFVNDYHGDDAFEVPDGMHSEHQAVPVRGRGASAGR